MSTSDTVQHECTPAIERKGEGEREGRKRLINVCVCVCVHY